MIQIIPHILLMIGWNPAAVDESMAVSHRLYGSVEACEAAGKAFVEERKGFRLGNAEGHFRFICIPAPTAEEYEGVFRNPE